jgi:hypothetical protein
MEADISLQASVVRHLASQRKRPRFARTARIVGLLGTLAFCSCRDDEARAVQVREPTPSPSDGGARDAAQGPPDAAPVDPHGPAPIWPPSEQTLDLDFRGSARAVLSLAAEPSQLDVHFNVDTTASFRGEIDAIQRELTRSIIPRLRSRVADTQLGVSRFADFPVPPFGRTAAQGVPDVPYKLLSPITDVLAKVASAVSALDRPLGDGGDGPEAAAEALFQIATGAGLKREGRSIIEPFDRETAAAQGGGTLGGVGFRSSAFRVVLHITDAPSHKPEDYAPDGIDDTHSLGGAAIALNALGVHVIGICSTGTGNPSSYLVRAELSELALATGAYTSPESRTCPTGLAGEKVPSYDGRCPLVFDVSDDGTGLANSIVDSVVGLLDEARFASVHAEVANDPLGFISKIELVPVAQQAGVSKPNSADLLPKGALDGIPDSYLDVQRLQKLGFSVTLDNARIQPSDVDQRFRVSIRLVADGVSLEERVLAVRIPAVTQPVAADDDAGT